MDFDWTEQQRAYRDAVQRFAREQLGADVAARDQEGRFCRESWQRCADFGIQGLGVPPEYGGREIDLLTAVLAMEALGYGCADNGLTFALNAQIWTVQQSIVRFGSDEQRRRYLPGMCRGALIGAHCVSEPEAGSDLYQLRTTAVRRDGAYELNGTKTFITLGPIADVALVFATVDPSLGQWGITAFLVDCDTPGLARGPMRHKMGLRTAPIGEIALESCLVPESCRLGKEGNGVAISNSSLEMERACILASQLGAMQRQLEASVAYARQRRQFDQPIGKFQAVSHRIADMKVRLEAARLMVYKAAWLKQKGRPAVLEAAMAKLYLSECFVESSMAAIRTHGGRGYLTAFGVERDLRDAIGGVIYGGTSDIQRNVIAGMLGL